MAGTDAIKTLHTEAPARPVTEAELDDGGIFTAALRCDTCGAQAFTAAIVNGADLYYCGHHFAKYEKALSKVASTLVDRRDRINVRASQSSPD